MQCMQPQSPHVQDEHLQSACMQAWADHTNIPTQTNIYIMQVPRQSYIAVTTWGPIDQLQEQC